MKKKKSFCEKDHISISCPFVFPSICRAGQAGDLVSQMGRSGWAEGKEEVLSAPYLLMTERAKAGVNFSSVFRSHFPH
jgi:hypothetical protein